MGRTAWQEDYLSRYYLSRPGWVNGTAEFHELCAATIPKGGRILEIGAGPSNRTSVFLAAHGELHGIDPDPDVETNTALVTATRLQGDAFPYPEGAFDACVSDYVLEHVRDPTVHLSQVARVLRPGGAYVFRTPNRLHYVAAVASLTPHWFHTALANRARNLGPEAHDPYPTFYAMNSRRAIARLSQTAGLRVETLRMVEKEPSYGMSSRLLFLILTAYERAVNSTELAALARANIFGVLRRS